MQIKLTDGPNRALGSRRSCITCTALLKQGRAYSVYPTYKGVGRLD